jgi:hypothetical protein
VISSAITSIFSHLGGRRSWRIIVSEKLADWVHSSVGHTETSTVIKEIELQGPEIPEQCFAAANVMAALGLFEASLAYEARGIALSHRGQLGRWTKSYLLREVQSAIHLGNRHRAAEVAQQLRARGQSPEKLPFSVLDVLHYVNVWNDISDKEIQRRMSVENPPWSDYVGGRNIVVYGPGNVHPNTPRIASSEVVVRIIGPGSYSWDHEGDLAKGRAEIAYVNPETVVAIGSSNHERVEMLGRFNFLCVKRGEALGLANSRKVEAGSRLFLRGHPNMVPLAVIDLLRIPGTNIRVIGSDFFASGSSYRPDSIRTKSDGRPHTQQGSTGNRFDRSTLIASHNAFQNRRLVKNLLDSGRVTGDEAFLEACRFSDLDYARRLDLHYGQHKL